MSFIGMIFIMSGSLYLSFVLYKEGKAAVEDAKLLMEFVCFMKRQIEHNKAPLEDIITEFCGTSNSIQRRMKDINCENLTSFLSGLAHGSKVAIENAVNTIFDSPLGALEICRELEDLCRKTAAEKDAEFNKKKKTLILLPIFAGVMLIILLV